MCLTYSLIEARSTLRVVDGVAHVTDGDELAAVLAGEDVGGVGGHVAETLIHEARAFRFAPSLRRTSTVAIATPRRSLSYAFAAAQDDGLPVVISGL